MDQIIGQIGSTIGGFFGNPAVQFALQLAAVYVVGLWLASGYWAFRDLQGRTDNPVAPYLAASLVILFTPVFFLLAIVVYRIVRPHERIGDVNERSLAEEALLNEVEAVAHCPACHRRIHDEWLICPSCRTRLNRVCPNCSRLVGLDWSLCAWCGKDFERREVAAAFNAPRPAVVVQRTEAPALPAPTQLPMAMAAAQKPAQAAAAAGNSAPGRGTQRKSGLRASVRKASGPLPER
ncbi:MAG: zinc ribbon domain-containing protein [Chloroflexota bacterium]